MSAPVKVRKIGEVVRELRQKMEDAALEGNYAASEKVAVKLQEIEELQALGELYVIGQ